MTTEQKIVIPLILCLLALPFVMARVSSNRMGRGFSQASSGARIVYDDDFEPVGMNEETWQWVDYKGRDRSLTVHRKVSSRGR